MQCGKQSSRPRERNSRSADRALKKKRNQKKNKRPRWRRWRRSYRDSFNGAGRGWHFSEQWRCHPALTDLVRFRFFSYRCRCRCRRRRRRREIPVPSHDSSLLALRARPHIRHCGNAAATAVVLRSIHTWGGGLVWPTPAPAPSIARNCNYLFDFFLFFWSLCLIISVSVIPIWIILIVLFISNHFIHFFSFFVSF